MSVLDQSHPHFVRCIKPNNHKAPNQLDTTLTLQQLRYSGVLEAVHIRKSGFPVRRSHVEFRQRYWAVSGISRKTLSAAAAATATGVGAGAGAGAFAGAGAGAGTAGSADGLKCQAIAQALAAKNPAVYSVIHVGKTTVFFKAEALTALEKERTTAAQQAVLAIQRTVGRGVPVWRKFPILLEAFRSLTRAILQGSLHRCSNFKNGVLVALSDALQRAMALGIVASEVRTGQRLETRLMAVQGLVGRMAQHLAVYAGVREGQVQGQLQGQLQGQWQVR
jgi:myosin heavy subunit